MTVIEERHGFPGTLQTLASPGAQVVTPRVG
jgi:hypothetical protein